MGSELKDVNNKDIHKWDIKHTDYNYMLNL